MLRNVLSRIVWTIPVVFIAVTLTFFLIRSIGGDPFRHGPLVGLTAQGGWQKYGDYQPQSDEARPPQLTRPGAQRSRAAARSPRDDASSSS